MLTWRATTSVVIKDATEYVHMYVQAETYHEAWTLCMATLKVRFSLTNVGHYNLL